MIIYCCLAVSPLPQVLVKAFFPTTHSYLRGKIFGKCIKELSQGENGDRNPSHSPHCHTVDTGTSYIHLEEGLSL